MSAEIEQPKPGFWDRVLVRFRRRRLHHWEARYVEAHGRVLDIELGQKGVTWKMAMLDRTEAENNAAYYRAKLASIKGEAPNG